MIAPARGRAGRPASAGPVRGHELRSITGLSAQALLIRAHNGEQAGFGASAAYTEAMADSGRRGEREVEASDPGRAGKIGCLLGAIRIKGRDKVWAGVGTAVSVRFPPRALGVLSAFPFIPFVCCLFSVLLLSCVSCFIYIVLLITD
jgi:hypothetical protein